MHGKKRSLLAIQDGIETSGGLGSEHLGVLGKPKGGVGVKGKTTIEKPLGVRFREKNNNNNPSRLVLKRILKLGKEKYAASHVCGFKAVFVLFQESDPTKETQTTCKKLTPPQKG